MRRLLYTLCGWAALLLGGVGMVLPLLPTVPFVILAAFCFARSSPRLEDWLVNHPQFGPHICNWRTSGAITRKGKIAALIAFAFSAMIGLVIAPWPWAVIPAAAALIGGGWISTRPNP